MKYKVSYDNEILGSNTHIMTKKEIAYYNKCALILSDMVDIDNKPHSSGMWTIEKEN